MTAAALSDRASPATSRAATESAALRGRFNALGASPGGGGGVARRKTVGPSILDETFEEREPPTRSSSRQTGGSVAHNGASLHVHSPQPRSTTSGSHLR